jgi:hypothetical protein
LLRNIFGPKRDAVRGDWKRLHDGNLRSPHPSPNIIGMMKSKRIRWARRVARMGERRGPNSALVGKLEGKRKFGRPRRRWADNTMGLQEITWDCIDLAQNMGSEELF